MLGRSVPSRNAYYPPQTSSSPARPAPGARIARPDKMSIRIRPLHKSEWPAFKTFRLGALKAAPGMFATSYEEAAARSAETWQANIAGPCNQVFGLFDGAHLIGITGVFGSGDTAYLVMSFILPAYRRRGLSAMLYQARLEWIRMRREFKRAVTAIRASNEVSQRVCRAFGFTCIGREARTWPDGSMEDELIFELQMDVEK
jgi:RimJ/RimL family protein N-acetyltransferase